MFVSSRVYFIFDGILIRESKEEIQRWKSKSWEGR